MALKQRRSDAAPLPPRCAVGECMALLGGAWTANVVWHLSGGPRRFGELRRDMPPISPKMLSARLRDLEAKGVVMRVARPTAPPSVDYELTPLGRELVPAIEAIVAVGHKLKALAGNAKRAAAE
ncbi:winged helix-turn-helix transcriptional regulator [Dongia sp.]|uniref:winged helix-turn-helix transcriptional regulator n=1 Tax=Dongia sp. TaxID=1977262 RepID=UPI0035B2D560